VVRPRVFVMVLAGGEGTRLLPLTAHRAKPAVPFGGIYRLVDFVLSNFVNADYRKIAVLTQNKSSSLDRHISVAWRLSPTLGSYVTPVSPQMRSGENGFVGSADAIYQNLGLINDERPDCVCVFGADHIYRMDPRQMVAQHVRSGAAVTVSGVWAPATRANEFGVIETAADRRRIARFAEKPPNVAALPGVPDQVFASMGNYVFTTHALIEAVTADAANERSAHDLGGDVIPRLVERGEAEVYAFDRNEVPGLTRPGQRYWRDVGTLDAYYQASMDLVEIDPEFSLYNLEWPLLTWIDPLPPAKFVFDEPERRGHAIDSMVCPGVIVSGGVVRRSILSPGVVIHSFATVEDSVLLHGVDVGRGAVVRRAIVDKHARIRPGARIGVDPELDRQRFVVSTGGIVVIGKDQEVG
jgi:glucose-1-phosphate adenylyltransferase